MRDYVIIGDAYAVSFRDTLLVFEDATTVAQANALLTAYGLTLEGALPSARVLLVELPAHDVAAAMATTTALSADPRVRLAIVDSAGAPDALPPNNLTPGLWTWDAAGPDGNWGLELIRAPQLWNLDTYARRNQVANRVSVGVVDDGFDVGHPDLGSLRVADDNQPADHGTLVAGVIGATFDDNEGVEGVNPWLERIHGRPATFRREPLETWGAQLDKIEQLLADEPAVKAVNNSYGLSRIYGTAVRHIDPAFDPDTYEYGDLNGDNDHADTHVTPDEVIKEWPAADSDGNNVDDTWADVAAEYGRIYEHALARSRADALLVASAGNAGARFDAEDNSPIANAAVRYGGRFVAVESIDPGGATSTFSDLNGSVSAPGGCVRSTEHDERPAPPENFDRRDCPWFDGTAQIPVDHSYATESGTSFAAPHVTALVAALWKLEPELTAAQVRALATAAGTTVDVRIGGARPRIDAFAAAIGIDAVRGTTDRRRALVDVDDGSPDGNLRVDPFSGTVVDKSFNPDDRPGDRLVTMGDFRVWRDAYLQTGGGGLDGPTTHFRRDLNRDGCVGARAVDPPHPVDVSAGTDCADAPGEDRFPRHDFNGDGSLADWTATAPFQRDPDQQCGPRLDFTLAAPPGCMRDIDVLAAADLWLDEEQVAASPGEEGACPDCTSDRWAPQRDLLGNRDGATLAPPELKALPDYVHSFDVHVRIDWAAVRADSGRVGLRLESEVAPDAAGDPPYDTTFARDRDFTRRADGRPTDAVVTLPLWTGRARARWSGAGPDAQRGCIDWSDLQLGADRALEIPQDSGGCDCETQPTIVGTSGDDRIVGTPGPDVIAGLGGNDDIEGAEGNDLICGGDGHDRIHGASGDDDLAGDAGEDLIRGGEDDDAIDGGAGDDSLDGDAPWFLELRPNGDDVLDGGDGDDVLTGDGLVVFPSTVYGPPGDDVLDGGPGEDTVGYPSDQDVDLHLSLDGLPNDGQPGAEIDDLLQIENIESGAGDDTIIGDANDNYFADGHGDDTIQAGAGDDSFEIDDGNDVIDGDAGQDLMNDIAADDGNDVLDGGAGSDFIDGGAGDDRISGGDGLDSLNGRDGHDELSGGDDEDMLYGHAGNDTIDGGAGDDEIEGGAGENVIDGGPGRDDINIFGENDGDDVIHGGDGGDQIAGQLGDDEIYGEGGPDELLGDPGNDVIYGGDDHDYLVGGLGDDYLDGGAGEDSVHGGDGIDTCFGEGTSFCELP